MLCDPNEAVVVARVSHVALTTLSLPSVVLVPAFLLAFGWMTWRRGLMGWADILLWPAATALIVLAGSAGPLSAGGVGMSGLALIWPFALFIAVYAGWRVTGGNPLTRWPWFRFGLLATLSILSADLLIAFMTLPPGENGIWQLGGGCLRDALVMAPPLLALFYYGILDCRSPLVFCSRKCRDNNRCRYGLDGAQTTGSSIEAVSGSENSTTWWKRGLIALFCATAVLFAYTALPFSVPAPVQAGPEAQLLQKAAVEESERIAEIYGVPAPHVYLLRSPVAGLTKPPLRAGEASTIELGLAVQSGRFLEDMELLRAVVAHEMGHVIQHARGEAFPTLLIFVLYVASLAAVPATLPTWRGRAVWVAASLSALTLLSGLPGLALPAHSAILWLLLIQLALLTPLFAWRSAPSIGHLYEKTSAHLPGFRAYTLGALAGLVLFFALGGWFGSMNTERELMADRVAACETGPDKIREALSEFYRTTTPPGGWVTAALFDPFHPTTNERFSELDRLGNTEELVRQCVPLRLHVSSRNF